MRPRIPRESCERPLLSLATAAAPSRSQRFRLLLSSFHDGHREVGLAYSSHTPTPMVARLPARRTACHAVRVERGVGLVPGVPGRRRRRRVLVDESSRPHPACTVNPSSFSCALRRLSHRYDIAGRLRETLAQHFNVSTQSGKDRPLFVGVLQRR